jgi:hypothetical protein
VAVLEYVSGKKGISSLPANTAVIGYDRARFTDQVDLKTFADTGCPLTLQTSVGALLGPDVQQFGKDSVVFAAAEAKLG